MTQKIHGDLEITGAVTAGGEVLGSGGLGTQLVEMSVETGGNRPGAVDNVGGTSHDGNTMTPQAASLNIGGAWNNSANQFTAPEDGVYVVVFESVVCANYSHGGLRSGGWFVIDTGGGDVWYSFSAEGASSHGMGRTPVDGHYAIKLSAGDKLKLGLTMAKHGSPYDPNRIHTGSSRGRVEIWKR